MLKKLKLKRVVNLILGYNCVGCGNEKWIDNIEAKTPGFKFVCPVCRHVNEIEPINIVCNIRLVKPIFRSAVKSKRGNSGEKDNRADSRIDTKVVKIIQTYGHTKKEGRQFVDKAREYLLGSKEQITEESLLKCAFVYSGD